MTTQESGEQGAQARGQPSRWAAYANAVLGAWLLSTPVSLGYESQPALWNDVVAGAVVLGLALLSLRPRTGWTRWAIALVGLWLLLAPLVFQPPEAVAYLNDTAVGVLLILTSVVIAGMPGLRAHRPGEPAGREQPRGWAYNPSTWPQRLPPVFLAAFGFLVARYLTAFQLGYISEAWDPFFPSGTERVLTSRVSEAFPVSDAGLGALGYLMDALAGLAGSERRWRTRPWIVLVFGFFIIPLGAVSIALVMAQPILVGAWCTLCLVTAAVSLLMIPFAVDEVVASGQFLWVATREGRPFWRTFWQGAGLDEGPFHEAEGAQAGGGGITPTWTLAASAALGVWLMFAPAVLGYGGALQTSDRIVGPMVVSFAVIATAEVARAVRLVNVPLGVWVIAAPWLLDGTVAARGVAFAVGVAIVLLSIPRARVRGHYGPWERFVV